MFSRIILHCDMDAFFAAVEARENPQLRGKPVIVGADPKGGEGRGVVSTASYEARKFGVRSAQPISEAYRRCPNGIFLPPRGDLYRGVSRNIREIFLRYTPLVEPVSIDEAFLDVTGSARLLGDGAAIARRIKEDVRKEERLTVSVGVAPNKFLAKVASDLNKPDGLTIVEPGKEKEFLAPLPIERLWGVGEKTAVKLKKLGFLTIGDIAKQSLETVKQALGGGYGEHIWRLAQGFDTREVKGEREKAKSLSIEETFDEDTADPAVIHKTLLDIAESLSRKVREEGYAGKTVQLKLRYEDFRTLTRDKTSAAPICSAEEIFRIAKNLFEANYERERKVRLLGIGLSNLVKTEDAPLALFDEGKREEQLAKTIDEVVRAFGKDAITRASLVKPPPKR